MKEYVNDTSPVIDKSNTTMLSFDKMLAQYDPKMTSNEGHNDEKLFNVRKYSEDPNKDFFD